MAKTASNHSKAHMDDMNKKAAAAHKKQTIERIKAFLEQSENYFDVQDRLEQAYSEAGLANAMRWTVQRLQGYYDYNDGREDEVVEAQVEAFEAGDEEITDPRCVFSYYVRLAYQRIQEQITDFVTSNSRITREQFSDYMMATGQIATDVGTIVYGREAVESGLIDRLGGLHDALECLHRMISRKQGNKG